MRRLEAVSISFRVPRARRRRVLRRAPRAAVFAVALIAFLSAPLAATAVTRSVDNQSFLGCNDLFGNPYCTIHAAIADSSSGDVISVGAGTYLGNHLIPAGLAISIVGSGESSTLVQALPNDRVFTVSSGASLLMSALTVDGGQVSGNGGGIHVQNAQLSLSQVTLSNHTANLDGGAIFASGSLVELNGVTATGNTGDRGGALHAEGVSAVTTISGGAFHFNNATMGGAIHHGGSLTVVEQTLFNGNTARFGGAVFQSNGSIGQISDATLRFNSALDYGGAVFVAAQGQLSVFDSFFNRNKAEEPGDAVHDGGAIANFGNLALDSVVTSGDTARNGGTLYNEGTVNLLGSTITGGVALEDGGGIYSTGTIVSTNTVFRFNQAGNEGGGVWNDRGDFTMTGGHFFSNSAGLYGGGMRTAFGDADITGVAWFGNSSGSGGALYSYFTGLDLSASEFYDNDAINIGGAIQVFYGLLSWQDVRVHDNTSGSDGGGLLLLAQGLVERLESFGNTSGGRGGGLFVYQNLNLIDANIHSNHAVFEGGGVANEGRTTFVGSRITGNRSDRDGGGIFSFRSSCNQCEGDLTLVGTTVDSNVASNIGGGLAVRGGVLRLENSTVSMNQSNGPGIASLSSSSYTTTLDLDHVTVAGNQGGGLGPFDPADPPSIRHSVFAYNGPDCFGLPLFAVNGPSADTDGSCGPSFSTVSIPYLGPLVTGSGLAPYHVIAPESPLVDAGDPVECLPVDQLGGSRIGVDGNGVAGDGDSCDLGAFERQDAIPVPESGSALRTLLALLLIACTSGRRPISRLT